jgi:hypothetical protein
MSELKTTVTFSSQSDSCQLENYPASNTLSITFDGNDCTVYAYVEQFRCFLRACGFSEKNITDALGEF